MLRGLLVIIAAALSAVAALAAPAVAVPELFCTAAQKKVRVAAVESYLKRMVRERQAYFASHRAADVRAAFVRRQRARLAALRKLAACTVPTLPPSSDASCDYMLAPPPQLDYDNTPLLHEGPIQAGFVASIGQVRAVMLFIDFPDGPGDESTTALATLHASKFGWFPEASYGRFSVAVTPVHQWFRMPKPASQYSDYGYGALREVFGDAVAAADHVVDFSQYHEVLLIPSRAWIAGKSNKPFSAVAGAGVPVDGSWVDHGTILNADVRQVGDRAARAGLHEFMHTLGLVDSYGPTVGSWDPMSGADGAALSAPASTHLLGWHKWRLGWLDAGQITCLFEADALEETVTPMAVKGGKKLVLVPMGDRKLYAVEVRRRIGYDAGICKEGVLVYTIDQDLAPSTYGTVVQGPRTCGTGFGSPFHAGQTFEDDTVKVEVLATDGKAYRIRVTRK